MWPLGKIIRTEASRDGLVRKVDVLIKGNVVRRPVNSLVLLVANPAEDVTQDGGCKGIVEDQHRADSEATASDEDN